MLFVQDGSTNCRQDSDCPDAADKCGKTPKGPPKVCGSMSNGSKREYECFHANGELEVVFSCDGCSGDCVGLSKEQAFDADLLKVTTATSGQTFR